jgi:glycosyltransferase involved in cell wall biosynthesis
MICFDVTKAAGSSHQSGLTRVSARLWQEFGDRVVPVVWDGARRNWIDEVRRVPVPLRAGDWLLTAELFCEAERPGLWTFIEQRSCHLAAVFHDAIPLQLPHITWPQSVQRHPEYMKMLARFDRVWAVSAASAADLLGYWRWLGTAAPAGVDTLALGADFDNLPRVQSPEAVGEDSAAPLPAAGTGAVGHTPALLCVGIVEPRKNQGFLLDVCERLWRDGLIFNLRIAGRVNPHFGRPLERRILALGKRESRLQYYSAPRDPTLRRLYARARATVFPTRAEGCGLPLLESLWSGVPCVGSDLPVLRENAAGGGCLLAAVGDSADWERKLRLVLTDDVECGRLRLEAMTRPLARWADTARQLITALT